MAEKRYYWIKLKTDFFNQEAIDYMMGQKNGCEYIVLYQMLCLQTANNGGELSSKVGEFIVPYNVDKIVRDTKYFDTDTVIVALELFKKLGLIYEQEENNILRISNHEKMVGSETASAERKRSQRAKIAQKPQNTNNMLCKKA
jgi:predicted phage replisome organizer